MHYAKTQRNYYEAIYFNTLDIADQNSNKIRFSATSVLLQNTERGYPQYRPSH